MAAFLGGGYAPRLLALTALTMTGAFGAAQATDIERTPQRRWLETWSTAQPIVVETLPHRPLPPVKVPVQTSVRPVGPPPLVIPTTISRETVRMLARVTVGGNRLRLSFSNPNGADPVHFSSVHVALAGVDGSTIRDSDRTVTFGGRRGVTLFAGSVVSSDPVDLTVPALSDIAVSIYVPSSAPTKSVHLLGLNPTIIAGGDQTAEVRITGGVISHSYFWLNGIAVPAQPGSGAIVAMGDSITDGYATTAGEHRNWPELLAERLRANPATREFSVLNVGISGGRLLRPVAGSSVLARFDRDVLARPGVTWMILLIGINDINAAALPKASAAEQTSAAEIIEGYRQLIDRCHAHGIRVMGATLLPTGGLPIFSEKTEAIRQAVNRWIRVSGAFDAVADFDAAVRDPAEPTRILPAYDPGDHVHPNDAANATMAQAIPISEFARAGARGRGVSPTAASQSISPPRQTPGREARVRGAYEFVETEPNTYP